MKSLIYVRTEGSHLKSNHLGILRKKMIKARKINAAILYWEGHKLEWSNNFIHSLMCMITVIKTRKALVLPNEHYQYQVTYFHGTDLCHSHPSSPQVTDNQPLEFLFFSVLSKHTNEFCITVSTTDFKSKRSSKYACIKAMNINILKYMIYTSIFM